MTHVAITALRLAGDVLVAASIAFAVTFAAAAVLGERPCGTRRPPVDECYGVALVRDPQTEDAR